MLSKALAVPKAIPSKSTEEVINSENEVQEVPQNAVEIARPVVGDRVVEEPRGVTLNENMGPERSIEPRQFLAGATHEHQHIPLQKREVQVQKPADDRLFTLAVVGLTIAIAVLLFKKFMKASGHGVVFMDES